MKKALCSKCGERKNVDQFGKNKSRSTGLQAYCKPCRRAHDKARLGVTKRYGITREQLMEMLASQDFRCAICDIHSDEAPKGGAHRSWIGLVVDHDHKTGEIRGLLCHPCNLGLGILKDDPEIIRNALEYLTVT